SGGPRRGRARRDHRAAAVRGLCGPPLPVLRHLNGGGRPGAEPGPGRAKGDVRRPVDDMSSVRVGIRERIMTAGGPQKLVFVGGAPRSGTTVTHALICTSARVSEYHPEISFFRGLTQAYRNGRGAWKQHTSAFFSDPEAFRAHMRRTTDLS